MRGGHVLGTDVDLSIGVLDLRRSAVGPHEVRGDLAGEGRGVVVVRWQGPGTRARDRTTEVRLAVGRQLTADVGKYVLGDGKKRRLTVGIIGVLAAARARECGARATLAGRRRIVTRIVAATRSQHDRSHAIEYDSQHDLSDAKRNYLPTIEAL